MSIRSTSAFDLSCSAWLEDSRRKKQKVDSSDSVYQLGGLPPFNLYSGILSESTINVASSRTRHSGEFSAGDSLGNQYADSNFGALTSSSSSAGSLSPFSVTFPSSLVACHRISAYDYAVPSGPDLPFLDHTTSTVLPQGYLTSFRNTRETTPQDTSYPYTPTLPFPTRSRKEIQHIGLAKNCAPLRQDIEQLQSSLERYPHQKQQKKFSKDSGCSALSSEYLSYHRQSAKVPINTTAGTSTNCSYRSSVRTKINDNSPLYPSKLITSAAPTTPRLKTRAAMQKMKAVGGSKRNFGQGGAEKKKNRPTATDGKQKWHSETALYKSKEGGSGRRGVLMNGIAMVQKWVKIPGLSRQKNVDRTISLASTSGSTPILDDIGVDQTATDKRIDGNNSFVLSPGSEDFLNGSPTVSVVASNCGQHYRSSYSGHLGGYADLIDIPETSKINRRNVSPPGNQSISTVLRQALDVRGKYYIDHESPNPWNDKTKVQQDKANYLSVKNVEAVKPKQLIEHPTGQQGLSRDKGIINRIADTQSNSNGKSFNKKFNDVKYRDAQQAALRLPTCVSQQRIYSSTYPKCHHEDDKGQHFGSTHLDCFIKTRHADGTAYEIWVCRSRGDHVAFLESSNFEERLGRSFLRLAKIPALDAVADVIAYNTIKMLRSCRYAASDILQCVALALCHIRRVASRIIVHNSTEAAYVLCLQVFLAHCWLLDETCPIKEWHRNIFVNFCPFHSLNKAMMCLFEAQGCLSVDPELVHSAVHDLTSPY